MGRVGILGKEIANFKRTLAVGCLNWRLLGPGMLGLHMHFSGKFSFFRIHAYVKELTNIMSVFLTDYMFQVYFGVPALLLGLLANSKPSLLFGSPTSF